MPFIAFGTFISISFRNMFLRTPFSPFYGKKVTLKNHSTLEVDTFKVMLLLSYLASLVNKPLT